MSTALLPCLIVQGGQPFNTSGLLSKSSNLGTKTVGLTQQSAAEEDAPAEAAEAASASVGTAAGERAPVGAAALRANQADEPIPAQRTL